jgi:hypothetical protein
MKKLELRIVAELPEDEFERAEVLMKLRDPLAVFKKAVEDVGLAHVHETKVFSAKAGKPAVEGAGRRARAAE